MDAPTPVLPVRRAAAALAFVLSMAALLTLGSPVPGAHAGPNGGEGVCLKAYNYADLPSDYLYASTEGLGHPEGETCVHVYVEIGHYSKYHYPTGPGIEGSQCFNTYQISWDSSPSGYTSTSWSGDIAALRKPCSQHHASRYLNSSPESIGALLFQW